MIHFHGKKKKMMGKNSLTLTREVFVQMLTDH